MKALLVALLTATALLNIAVQAIRWRLPQQPRFALILRGEGRHRSPQAELAIELGIISVACLLLPAIAIALTVLPLVVASHVG